MEAAEQLVSHTFVVPLSLSYYTIAMLLVDACESSSEHWIDKLDAHFTHNAAVHSQAERRAIIGPDPARPTATLTWPLYVMAPFVEGCTLEIHVRHNEETAVARVGRQQIENAVKLFAEKHLERFVEVLNGCWDGEDSNTFLQLAAFGEVRYVD